MPMLKNAPKMSCSERKEVSTGDIGDDNAAMDVGRIGAVGTLRVDVDVMRAEAIVDACMTHRRRHVVALTGAGQPPASRLDGFGGIAYVDHLVKLMVLRVGRCEVRSAAADMHVLAIH